MIFQVVIDSVASVAMLEFSYAQKLYISFQVNAISFSYFKIFKVKNVN